jgi:SAM-dependent methyltransferase
MPDSNLSYFEHSRTEIAGLLPASPRRILEIGCGAGATLAWLKTRFPDAYTVGVDGYPPVLDTLTTRADLALIHDLEAPLPDLGGFDLILALDVLEHLRQPEQVLQHLTRILNTDGRIIVSVPNVAHHSVLRDLVLRRRFEYQDDGILDRTHLRFYTESSAIGLMNAAGLQVINGAVNGLAGPKTTLINRVTLGMFKHYFVKQYIMAGERDGQQRPAWMTTQF